MSKPGKRIKTLKEQLEPDKVYPPQEAFMLMKESSSVKFKESVDVSVNLGIDPKKSDQQIRGSTDLPHGLGKQVRVAVFAHGDKMQEAEAVGADAVGMDDLAERVSQGDFDFDVVIASPDAMPVVGKLGRFLGPKGLMPNPKVGTVTDNVAAAVKSAKAGQARYRTDKGGVVHATIGKLSFEVKHLEENLAALLDDLIRARPASAKGVYLKKVTVSSTMGPGLSIDYGTLIQ